MYDDEKYKHSYDEAKRVGNAYKAYLDQLVHVEYLKFFAESLAMLEESGTPYFAHLAAPHPPHEDDPIPDVKIDGAKTFTPPAELKRFVQYMYAYSFQNNHGGEKSLIWQKGHLTMESKKGTQGWENHIRVPSRRSSGGTQRSLECQGDGFS